MLDGRLAPGARLPSARSLAAQLSIARGTVETAYQVLAGEGYIVARGAAGTLVAPALDRKLLKSGAVRSTRAEVSPPAAAVPLRAPALFRMGLPALDAFPHKVWSRLFARQARSMSVVDLAYQSPAGHESLRIEVARYLAVARGVTCAPEQIFITGGFQGALGLIMRCLLQPGDTAWVEDPGYDNARNALRLAGARLVAVPVDRRRDSMLHWAVAKARARAAGGRDSDAPVSAHGDAVAAAPAWRCSPGPRRRAGLDRRGRLRQRISLSRQAAARPEESRSA